MMLKWKKREKNLKIQLYEISQLTFYNQKEIWTIFISIKLFQVGFNLKKFIQYYHIYSTIPLRLPTMNVRGNQCIMSIRVFLKAGESSLSFAIKWLKRFEATTKKNQYIQNGWPLKDRNKKENKYYQ